MAQPANTHATNDMEGIREDLAETIYNVDPVDVPFSSTAPRMEVTNTLHEWQTDDLDTPANNAVIEGDDATTDAASPTVRLSNNTQISDKVARTTDTARAVNTAGRADEHDYQIMNKAKSLKNSIELIVMSNKAKVAGDDSTARELAGIPAYIVTNIDEASDATTAAGTGADAHTDGTARRFEESQLKAVQKLAWDNGGNPDVLMTGGFNRQIASSFTGNGTKMQKAEDSRLHASFDVYDGDFGELRIIPNRRMPARTVLGLDMDMVGLGFLPGRNMKQTELAKTGDSTQTQIISEYTVKVNNEKAHFAIYDLTTS